MMKFKLQPFLRMAFILTLLATAIPTYCFEVDGIYYSINEDEVSVTVISSGGKYSGSVIIPSSITYNDKLYKVTAIGSDAFSNSGVNNVDIPNTVTSIGHRAFASCRGLTSMTIPNSVISIGSRAFYNCSGLTTLNFNAEFCADFGEDYYYQFSAANNIKTINIGSSVRRIPANFAYGTTKLENISIPNTVSEIGSKSFYYCSKLTNVTIPSSVTSIGNSAFQGCNALATLNYDAVSCADFNYGDNHQFYDCNISTINIGSNVNRIPSFFANNLTTITSITIPRSVASIGESAFANCSGLTSVHISDLEAWCGIYFENNFANPLWYAHHLFLNNEEINELVIPNSFTSIHAHAFQSCTGLTSVTIPNSVIEIGESSFSGCINLMSVNIPYSVSLIGSEAFFSCMSLTKLDIPGSVTTIGNYAFYNCSSLTSVTIPNLVTEIADHTFGDCISLTNVTIPDRVTKIDNYAFGNCCSLASISIGESVNTIEDDAFYYCAPSKLTWKAKKCLSMGGLIKSNISSLSIGSNVEHLPSYFVAGSKIKTASIPNLVTRIEDHAFYDCNDLTTLRIGNSVNSIGQSAFLGSKNLTKVYCRANMPPMYEPSDNRYFEDIAYQNSILYVPDLTYSFYKQSEPWKKFMDIKTESFSSNDGYVDFDSMIYPTSVRINATSFDDELIENDYFTFMDEKYNPLVVTGLEPLNLYSTTYTIMGDIAYRVPLKFYTSELRMVPEGGKMLTATAAQLMAETNMADEETMCGFDWRRSDGPEDYLGTRAYCPVYDGKMAGTLKNLSKDTWYKFRPFYKSSAGNVYYGDWVTFYSGDWGVEFDPVVYTYNSPAVSETEATLQGVALRGSREITEQGFEYWKNGTSNVKKVTASGERMSATVSGLESNTSYKFRAFVTSDGKTLRGSDVEFVTRSGEQHVNNGLDVNTDGVVNIADMNVVINVILSGSDDHKCDVNGDGTVNISDINTIISAILAN